MPLNRVLIFLGVAVMVATLVLPLWAQPQVLALNGPQVEHTPNRTYWVDIRMTPPIRSGTKMLVTLVSSRPGSAAILVFPSTPDGDMKGPSMLAEVLAPTSTQTIWTLTAPQDSNYMFVVTSWNSTYTLTVESSWSPFYETKTGLLVGFALAFGGGLLEYYRRNIIAERRKWGEFYQPDRALERNAGT